MLLDELGGTHLDTVFFPLGCLSPPFAHSATEEGEPRKWNPVAINKWSSRSRHGLWRTQLAMTQTRGPRKVNVSSHQGRPAM